MRYHETQIQQHQAARLLNHDYSLTRENILGDGLKLCRRAKAFNTADPTTAYIKVENKNNRLTAKMQDVVHCGNAHLCPFCAGAKAAHMRDWITEMLIPACQLMGLVFGLLTLTARHKRESDWGAFVEKFYAALTIFSRRFDKELKRVGSLGRVRAMESPVGSNGLHLHIHDLITYVAGMDVERMKERALQIWKDALREQGLSCTSRGVDFRRHSTFNPLYIAKEMSATDAKKESKSDLVTLFELLNRSARGNTQAGEDWIRAARAIQGRDRWNVGQLAAKLGIPTPSEWKRPQGTGLADGGTVNVITYPQAHHMHATSPTNPRPGLAHILNAAIRETRNPATAGRTAAMALRMCAETIKADIEALKHKHAHKLAEGIKKTNAATDGERQKLAARHLVYWMQDVADYKRETHARLFPAPAMLPLPPLWGPAPDVPDAPPPLVLEFGQELEFC
jgi:hypothetical protein